MLEIKETIAEQAAVVEITWSMSLSVYIETIYDEEDVNFVVEILFNSIGESALDAPNYLTHFTIDKVNGGPTIGDTVGEHYDIWEDLNCQLYERAKKVFPKASDEQKQQFCDEMFAAVEKAAENAEIMTE